MGWSLIALITGILLFFLLLVIIGILYRRRVARRAWRHTRELKGASADFATLSSPSISRAQQAQRLIAELDAAESVGSLNHYAESLWALYGVLDGVGAPVFRRFLERGRALGKHGIWDDLTRGDSWADIGRRYGFLHD